MTVKYNQTLYWKAKRPRLEGSSAQHVITSQSTVPATLEELLGAFIGTEPANNDDNAPPPLLIEDTQLSLTYPEGDDEDSDEIDEGAMQQFLEQQAEKEILKLRLEHEERMKEASERLKKLKALADAEAESQRQCQLELEMAERLKKKEAAKKSRDDALKNMLETKLNEFLQIERLKLQADELNLQLQISTFEAGLPAAPFADKTLQLKTPEPRHRVPASPPAAAAVRSLPTKNSSRAGTLASSAAVVAQPMSMIILNQKLPVHIPAPSAPREIRHSDAAKKDKFAQFYSSMNQQ